MRFNIGVRTKMIYKLGFSQDFGTFDLKLNFELFPLIIGGDHGLSGQGSHGLAAGLCCGGGLDCLLPRQALQVNQAWGLEWMDYACIGGDQIRTFFMTTFLMATLMDKLLTLGSHSILETYFCVLATNSNCFLNRVILLIGYTTRWGGDYVYEVQHILLLTSN